MHCNVQLAAFNLPAHSTTAALLPRRHALDVTRTSSCAHVQQQTQQQQHAWQKLQVGHSTAVRYSTSCRLESHRDMRQQEQQLQRHVCTHQPATANFQAGYSHRQQQQQLSQHQPEPLQQQQLMAITDAAVRNALQACSCWTALANYLLQPAQLGNHQQQQQQQQQVPMQLDMRQSSRGSISSNTQQRKVQRNKLLWQHLDSYQARLVVQCAAQLAAAQQQCSAQLAAGNVDAVSPDALHGLHSPPGRLQQPLALLLRRAVLRAAAAPGDAVVAADLLRCVWRLGASQQQRQRQRRQQQQQQQRQLEKFQQQRLLGQQLLDVICAGHLSSGKSVASAAAKRQRQTLLLNPNLLADVAQSVIQLQLQPSDEWLAWFGDATLAILQQQQPPQQQVQEWVIGQTSSQCGAAECRKPSSYFIISSLCLACYTHDMQKHQQQQQPQQHQHQQQHHQQQQRQLCTFPSDGWFQCWATAAAQLPRPFNNSQLQQVVLAVQKLQLQLPINFWHAHLSAAAARKLPAQRLFQLFVQLPPSLQHNRQQDNTRQQQQQQKVTLPTEWRAAAADLLVLHAASATSTTTAAAATVLQLLPKAVAAACQLQLPLQQGDVQQLLQVLLQERSAGAIQGRTGSSGSSSATGGAELASCCCSSSILSQASAKEAASAVTALAEMSISQPPPASLLVQLQLQLTPKLQRCNMQTLVDLLWVFAVKWRVQPSEPWLSRFMAATEPLLALSSPKQLRMLIVGLSLLQVAVPEGWMQAYLQATAAVMGSRNHSSLSGMSSSSNSSRTGKPPGQHHKRMAPAASTGQQLAAFLGNIAYSLVQLKITPSPGWQLAWGSAVARHAQHMSPNQLIDALYAAAIWAGSGQHVSAAAAVDTAAAAAASSLPAAVNSELRIPPVAAAIAVTAGSSSSGSALIAAAQASTPAAVAAAGTRQHSSSAPQLLPKPQRRWPEIIIISSSSNSCAVFQGALASDISGLAQQQTSMQHGHPRDAWVRVMLQQLRQLLPCCTPTHLTTALWCLRPLHYNASVAWLDAVCDALLGQLQRCSMLQLQQLLRSLLHQRHILAPARIDAVLDAALVLLLKGKVHCSEQQLVWLLQLVVMLHHEPEPEWTEQVAAAAEHMLCSSSNSNRNHVVSSRFNTFTTAAAASSSYSGWSPDLLTDLLEAISQLGGQELHASWAASYRTAVRCCLPHFTGLQLARVLSAAAFLHWEVPRPFQQLLLRQLQRHMCSLDVHALGLVGVAIGQMGLVMGRGWAQQYMARVQHLARNRSVKIPVSDVGNLQRSVQYLRWCGGRTLVLNRKKSLHRRVSSWSMTPETGRRRLRKRLKS